MLGGTPSASKGSDPQTFSHIVGRKVTPYTNAKGFDMVGPPGFHAITRQGAVAAKNRAAAVFQPIQTHSKSHRPIKQVQL